MSALKQLYTEIRTVLAAIPEIKTVRLYNSQFIHEDRENAFSYPCAFIEFGSIDWQSDLKGHQKGTINTIIHIGIEEYQTENLSNFDLYDKVFQALHLYQSECIGSLMRTRDEQDINHDNVIVWKMTFTGLIQDVKDTSAGKTQYTIPTLQVNKMIDIDNDVIRTGDGIF